MRSDFQPAIDALIADLRELERKVATTKQTINRLCELAGAPPKFTDANVGEERPPVTGIRSDQFYGRVQTTAAREYLELRHAGNQGPASPRQIYDALLAGGFKFDTKNELNALSGLRSTLRKNSSIFHKLPNGDYGLLSWYPKAKAASRQDDEEPESARKAVKPKGRPRIAAKRPNRKPPQRQKPNSDNPLRPIILAILDAGAEIATDEIRAQAAKRVAPGNPEPTRLEVHRTLLGLKSSKLASLVRKGTWRGIARRNSDAPDEGVVHLRTSAA